MPTGIVLLLLEILRFEAKYGDVCIKDLDDVLADKIPDINMFIQEVLNIEQRYSRGGGSPQKYGYPNGNPRRPGFENVGGAQVGILEHETLGVFGEGRYLSAFGIDAYELKAGVNLTIF